jgi:hypothetical protein
MRIYRIVQTILTGMLVLIAITFQGKFGQMQRPELFFNSIAIAVVAQLIKIWPVYKLAWRDADDAIAGLVPGLTKEQQAALRKKRLMGDMWKFCGVGFFLIFVTLAPDAKKSISAVTIMASTIFSFLLICLTYFQCFNFSAKKQMKG